MATTESPAQGEPAAVAAPFATTADAVLTETATAGAESEWAADVDSAAEAGPSDDNEIGDGAAADPTSDSDTHTSIGGLFAQYGKYVALFVGAGLISGSVVHFPLAPVRYAIIGAVGALLFAIASVVTEFGDRDPLRLLRVAVSSLALALGIGMISGSIQHFMDIPDRAALLIPLGVVLSLAAFGIRHTLRLKRSDLALIVPWLIIGVFALGFGLGKLADVAEAQGGGAGHGHGSSATDEHGGGADDPHGATGKAHDGGHGAGAADGHESEGAKAGDDAGHGKEDAHGEDGHGKEAGAAKDDAHAADVSQMEEDAHGEASGHAEKDAHADEDAHGGKDAQGGEDAHGGDSGDAKDTASAKEPSHGDKSSKAAGDHGAKESHQERLRFVP